MNPLIKTLANSKTGITIPLIKPYWETAIEYVRPDNSNRRGIRNCFNEESPDFIHDVIAIGKAILNIFLFICIGIFLVWQYFLLSIV